MRLRDVLVRAAIFLFVMALVTQKAISAEDELMKAIRVHVPAKPVPLPVLNGDNALRVAYYDTLTILSEGKSCAYFFGGWKAVDVFDQFIERVKKDYVAPSIGMRMSGHAVNFQNVETKTSYRLFDRVSINANGPFYNRKVSNTQAHVPGVGSFEPNSREVRVLMLLHELGHLVKGTDGKWLLPDDGASEDISRKNSEKVESVCGDEIRGLRKNDTDKKSKRSSLTNK